MPKAAHLLPLQGRGEEDPFPVGLGYSLAASVSCFRPIASSFLEGIHSGELIPAAWSWRVARHAPAQAKPWDWELVTPKKMTSWAPPVASHKDSLACTDTNRCFSESIRCGMAVRHAFADQVLSSLITDAGSNRLRPNV